MTPEFVIGVDIGTSSCKVALFDADGVPRGFNRAGYPITRTAAGRAEQNPDDWWSAVCAAMRRALAEAGVPGEAVAAIGLSGQIGTHVLIDRDGGVVRPAITWQDARAQAEVTRLVQQVGRPRLAEALGVDLPPGAAWPLPRLLWFKKHEPENLALAWRLLQPKEFVAHKLTGEYATDASSCRGLVRLPGGELAEELLRELELPLDLLAPRRPPAAVMGQVTRDAVAACGVAAGTPVVVGWNDLNCSLVGMGIVRAGQGFDIGGTSEHLGVALTADARVEAAQALMRVPFLAEDHDGAAQVFYGVTSAGGGALDWYADQFVPDLLASYGLALPDGAQGRLAEMAAAAPAGAGGLVFLPYLNGERAPIWDTAARGVFFGIGSQHRHRHFARAVLEGVALSLRQILELIEAGMPGARVGGIVASGGPAAMPLWNSIKASVLNRPFMIPQVIDAACLGAGMLAAVGVGWYAGLADAAEAMVHIAEQVDPEPGEAARYDRLYPIYASLYPQLQRAYAELEEFNRMETGNL